MTNEEMDRSARETRRARHIAATVAELHELEEHDQDLRSWSTRLADAVAHISGSMPFVAVHILWFGAWVALNLPGSPFRFDAFPFGLLTMVVSLEAIFLSLFVLMSENRQAAKDERHAAVDLEVNLIAEREITKALQLLAAIHRHLGLPDEGEVTEAAEMNEETHVGDLVEAVEEQGGSERSSIADAVR